jgi:hypothetical protein
MANSSIANFNKSNNVSAQRAPLGSGGDYEGEANGYRYHIFTASSDFAVTRDGAVECLIIAGGGSGGAGNGAGGGGGAGGLILSSLTVSAGTYSVVVGDGGAGVLATGSGNTGSDSTFAGLTAKGGGFGHYNGNDGGSGGSGGGGASGSGATGVGGSAIDSFTAVRYEGIGSQGHDGGGAPETNSKGGGGGGAGSPGHIARGPGGNWEHRRDGEFYGKTVDGGIGKRLDDWGSNSSTVAGTTIGDKYTYSLDGGGSADAYFFAGGGAGTDIDTNVSGAPGGGGSNGHSGTAGSGADGTGGGGGGAENSGTTSGDGGSGIVIVRYAA